MLKGAGHSSDMIGRIKANRSMLRKKSYFRPVKYYIIQKKSRRVILSKIQHIGLEKIKRSIQNDRTQSLKRKLIYTLISIIITVSLLLLFSEGIRFWYQTGLLNN